LLRPDAQVFDAMLEGWRQQQLSRNLAFGTVDARLELLRRFQDHSGEFPWQWTPQHLEEWSTDLRAVRGFFRAITTGTPVSGILGTAVPWQG
jgi:hypothetical protein